MNIILDILTIIVSLYLMFSTLKHRQHKPFWPVLTAGLMGLALFLRVTIGFIADSKQEELSLSSMLSLQKYEGICTGLFFGMLIVLCLCGFIRFGRKKDSQQGNGEVRKKAGEIE